MFTPLKLKLVIAIAGGLLIITFSLGILLTQTVGERRQLKTNLENANTKIKEQDGKIKEKTKEAESNLESFNGCQAKILEGNQAAVDQALAQYKLDQASSQRADKTLAELPGLIDKDKLASADPKAASKWLQSLFK